MRKVVFCKRIEVTFPNDCDHMSKEELVNTLNDAYGNFGNEIVETFGEKRECLDISIEQIDGEDVYKSGNCISISHGSAIILDGEQLDN